jgi:hypothetical protein
MTLEQHNQAILFHCMNSLNYNKSNLSLRIARNKNCQRISEMFKNISINKIGQSCSSFNIKNDFFVFIISSTKIFKVNLIFPYKSTHLRKRRKNVS